MLYITSTLVNNQVECELSKSSKVEQRNRTIYIIKLSLDIIVFTKAKPNNRVQIDIHKHLNPKILIFKLTQNESSTTHVPTC